MKQTKMFLKKTIQMAGSKKLIFSITNSHYFFAKILGIGPWVSRINWYEGHWFCSTYRVQFTAKNAILVFLPINWAYVRQPDKHIDWAKSLSFSSIDPTHPRTYPYNFDEKILRIGGHKKTQFSCVGHFGILFWGKDCNKKIINIYGIFL